MRLLVTADFDPEYLEILSSTLGRVVFDGWGKTGYLLTGAELIEKLGEIDILIVGYEQITRRVIENSSLKLIASIRGGPKANIDIEAATEKGIIVTYTVGRNKFSVADHTMALMLSLLRHICITNSLLKQRTLGSGRKQETQDVRWTIEPGSPFDTYKAPELHTLTMGLVGFGEIAREVAKRSQGFGMKVIIYDPYATKDLIDKYGVKSVGLDDLMCNSDVVSIHCNVTPETIGLIGRKQLSLMKKSAIIINTARASILDKDAFYHALLNKQIAGAGLDVFHREPLASDDPLLDLDTVVLTPHIAGASTKLTHHHSRKVTEDVLRFARGERPQVIANPEVFQFI
jgi:D-3-phosphoglycerate dehydrogenase / 2-oxoglutarate reductase